MIYIIGAVVMFFIAIMIHEAIHYLTAKHFGLKPYFSWVSTKDKKCTKITKYLPGVKFKDTFNYNQYRYITLLPFPICIIPFTMIFVIGFYPFFIAKPVWWFLPISLVFGTLASYGASMADFDAVTKFKKQKG